MKKEILFYIEQEYYWPSLKPVYDQFAADENFSLKIGIGKNLKKYLGIFSFSQQEKIEKKFIEKGYSVTRETTGFDAVFCGAQLKDPERFGDALLCNVDHGPGIKTLRYRHFLKQPDTKYICFVEGQYRIDKFKKYGLDKIEDVYDVGLPKLDVFFNGTFNREEIINKYNLDTKKQTVLYAPSYKPTSIFELSKSIAELSSEYNVIFKLHPYSWSGRYAPHSQHRFVEKLAAQYPDICIVPEKDHDILPFLFVADTLISEGSSVINEFLALERVGIIFDMEDVKHSDGQPLLEDESSTWLKDSFIHIASASEIGSAVEEALNPTEERLHALVKDKNYIFSYTDGSSAKRVKIKTEELLGNR